MKIEDFAIIQKSKTGKDCIIAYHIFNKEILAKYFEECNFKPSVLAAKLQIHYQSLAKLLKEQNLWKFVRTRNGKGIGQNRKRVRLKNKNGYMYSEDPNSYTITGTRSRRKLKHTEIMENFLGRTLNKGEIIHHINGNKLCNELWNLFLTNYSEHSKLHKQLEILAFQLFAKNIIKFDLEKRCYYIDWNSLSCME